MLVQLGQTSQNYSTIRALALRVAVSLRLLICLYIQMHYRQPTLNRDNACPSPTQMAALPHPTWRGVA
jgi:hypothetical protein